MQCPWDIAKDKFSESWSFIFLLAVSDKAAQIYRTVSPRLFLGFSNDCCFEHVVHVMFWQMSQRHKTNSSNEAVEEVPLPAF